MRIEHTSHFQSVIDTARVYNADSVSIQNFYSFCNFTNEQDAQSFLSAIKSGGARVLCNSVNTNRWPGKYWEVAVHHPS